MPPAPNFLAYSSMAVTMPSSDRLVRLKPHMGCPRNSRGGSLNSAGSTCAEANIAIETPRIKARIRICPQKRGQTHLFKCVCPLFQNSAVHHPFLQTQGPTRNRKRPGTNAETVAATIVYWDLHRHSHIFQRLHQDGNV